MLWRRFRRYGLVCALVRPVWIQRTGNNIAPLNLRLFPTHTIEAFAVYCRSHGLPIYGLIVLFTVRAAKQVWDILPPCRYAFSFSLRLSLLNIHYRRLASWQRAGGQVAIRLRRLVNLPALLGLCLDLPNRILFSFLVLICQWITVSTHKPFCGFGQLID